MATKVTKSLYMTIQNTHKLNSSFYYSKNALQIVCLKGKTIESIKLLDIHPTLTKHFPIRPPPYLTVLLIYHDARKV